MGDLERNDRMKNKSTKKPKVSFAQVLAEKLGEFGKVETGALSDKSSRWVNLRIGDTELCFSFEIDGERLQDVGLFKDVVQVVDQVRLWTSDKKTPYQNLG